MDFNKHWELEGEHAFLSPSKYHWVNYTDEKLISVYDNFLAAQKGTKLHAFAKDAIEMGIKLTRSKNTLNMYVNDAIGYRMTPEQILAYSENCFGTCDAISFRQNKLRIHDLKTGASAASMTQLEVYAALFCLEYKYEPFDIDIELRIYQNNEAVVYIPNPSDIKDIMDTIVKFDKLLQTLE